MGAEAVDTESRRDCVTAAVAQEVIVKTIAARRNFTPSHRSIHEPLVNTTSLVQNRGRPMLEENAIFAGRYQIVRRLASGGMGAVYEARHLETGRACALKVMLAHVAANASSRERFRLEARAAALVSSAHVVEVLDAGVNEATGSPFLVMELLRGEDLSSRVDRLGHLPAEDVAKFVFQAALGLDALHRAAIVHRDLKPSNLFLAKRDNAEIIKILDLGVAKRVIDTAVTTAVVGTPLYMAPEQMANRKILPATDAYALAMVAYSLLVGKEYWATEAETATSSIGFALLALDGPKEPATERAARIGIGLPAAFDDWFRRGTASDPADRFPDIVDAALNLCTALGVDSSAWRGDIERRMQPSEETSRRAQQFDAFAATQAEENAEKAHGKTITLGDAPREEVRAQTMGLAKTAPDEHLAKARKRRRILGGAALALLGIAATAAFFFRNRAPEKVVVLPPTVSALHCPSAEIEGPGASPHLADALAKGACARLGTELGVPWLDPQGTPLVIHAETRGDRSAHVILEVAQQKSEGDGKTLIGATNDAIKKLAPQLQVPPMSPERIAGWGARDAASALRIERAMRQKAFRLGDRLEIAKRVVATDVDAAIPHAMLACAAKNSEHELAIQEKKEALARLSAMPVKRAELVQASLMNFIPTPDDPPNAPSIVDSYTKIGEDPDFSSLFTMCGCVSTGISLPMADWLAKHAQVMGLPILPCTIGMGEAGRERSERHIAWIRSVLPEWQIDYMSVLVDLGKLDMAREAEDLLEWLDPESTSKADVVTSRMVLAFGSFDSAKAISITEASFGEPDAATTDERAIQYVNSLMFGGKVRTSLEVGEQRIYFLWRAEKYDLLANFAADHLRLRRFLDRPAPPSTVMAHIEQARAKVSVANRRSLDVELTLLRARDSKEKKSKDPTNELLETWNLFDFARDYKQALIWPMTRYYRGNEAAAKSYRDISLVNSRRSVAFEAGLALQSIGAKGEAEKAYRLCMDEPWNQPFDAIAARLRLAEMAKADGREDEARKLMAEVDRAWVDADPDLRDIVTRMK